ncbi:MAG TPA: ATP-binding cassette domain-containing protein [Solirubrobacteraceae bacterium]|jgi:predicted ABC-type transport system involved in lysophospholipase L1 biosynthesis ATPase subunit
MLWVMEPLLVLQGVHVHYRRGSLALRVLAGVSLELVAGEVVSVLAMRGQGKSTLLRVAAGMQRPDAGGVLLGGEELWGLGDVQRQRFLRESVGWVEVAAPALDVAVLEHVATPLLVGGGKREAFARARAVLERVGMSGCGGSSWGDLSDRERALVAVAGAVVRAPRLLVVDDLTCTLGLGETDEVTRLLCELSRELGVGVLMGVSDAGATQWSDRFMTLAGGELLAAPSRTDEEGGEVIEFPGGRGLG